MTSAAMGLRPCPAETAAPFIIQISTIRAESKTTLAGLCVQCCCHWALHIKYRAQKKTVRYQIVFQHVISPDSGTNDYIKEHLSSKQVLYLALSRNIPGFDLTYLSSFSYTCTEPTQTLWVHTELIFCQQQVSSKISHPKLSKRFQLATPQSAPCQTSYCLRKLRKSRAIVLDDDNTEEDHHFLGPEAMTPELLWTSQPCPNPSHSKKPYVLKPPPVAPCTTRWILQDTAVTLVQPELCRNSHSNPQKSFWPLIWYGPVPPSALVPWHSPSEERCISFYVTTRVVGVTWILLMSKADQFVLKLYWKLYRERKQGDRNKIK